MRYWGRIRLFAIRLFAIRHFAIRHFAVRGAVMSSAFVLALTVRAAPDALPVPAPPQAGPAGGSPASTDEMSAAAGAPADPALAQKGRGLYKNFCQKCHGLNMVSPGGAFFDLRTFPLDDKPRFLASVMNGKRAMPAWGEVLKGDDLETLWAYVRSGQAGK